MLYKISWDDAGKVQAIQKVTANLQVSGASEKETKKKYIQGYTILSSMSFTRAISVLMLFVVACNDIDGRSGKLAEKAEKSLAETYAATEDAIERTKEKIDQKLDKISPGYDVDKPDTDHNRNRFWDYLKVKPGKDVKDIYCFIDNMGIDYKVLIAFKGDRSTVDSIISINELKLSTEDHDNGLNFLDEFTWWDKERIGELKPYKKGKEGEYWQYLWYDKKAGKAWYLEFSL